MQTAVLPLSVYALLGFQLFLESIEITLLIFRCCGYRQLHLFGRVVKLPLRAVHARQSRVHEPLVRMFFGIVQEDSECFVVALDRKSVV